MISALRNTTRMPIFPNKPPRKKHASERFLDEIFYERNATLCRRQKEKVYKRKMLDEKSLKYFQNLPFRWQ